MDDLLPQAVPRAGFAYLVAAAAALSVLAWGRPGLVVAGAAIASVVATAGGASLQASWLTATALAATGCFAAMAFPDARGTYHADTPFKVALTAFMVATASGLLASVSEIVLAPFKARLGVALRDGRRRVVPDECTLVLFYGTVALLFVLHMRLCEAGPTLAPRVAGINAVLALVAARALVWDVRLRLRIRAILAGRVAGWRAIELPDDVAPAAPTLRWLDDLGAAIPRWASRHGRDRAIVRDQHIGEGAYRGAQCEEAPYVVVPPSVGAVGATAVLCALYCASLPFVWSPFLEMAQESGICAPATPW